jgi:hypothetical protein
MKTKKNLAIAIFGLLVISCSVVDQLLTFSLDNQVSFTVPAGFPVNTPVELLTPSISSNSTTVFENNDTRAELVKEVKLKEFKLTITNPSGKTFSFLKSVRMYISTNDTDEIELAYLDNITSTSNTLNLTCTTQKLDKYVKSPTFRLRAKAETKETVSANVSITADMKFQVTADPFQ